MSKFFTWSDVSEIFWEFEDQFSLIDLDIQGVKVWQRIRPNIFSEVLKKTLELSEFQETRARSNTFKNIIRLVKNSVLSNPYFSSKKDVLFFPHERVKKIEGDYYDIYTKYLIDEYSGKNILVLEKPYMFKHYSEKNKDVCYLDFAILWTSISRKLIKVNYNKTEQSFILKLNHDFQEKFGFQLDFFNLFTQSIKVHIAYYKFYKTLFKKLTPKKIFLVVSYGQSGLIQAAKENSIEVIELQHGTFSKYHMGYSYPNRIKEIDYFPDKLLVWNQYWKDLIKLPIAYENIKIYPFKFQENELKKYKDEKKIDKQVVVLSQGPLSNMMSKMILDNFDFFEDKTIKYKLHPGEFNRYDKYPYLQELLKKQNVELILQTDLYKLLAQSEYQVGVSSTALYEGLEFNLKTILLDLPSIEYMEKLINERKIYKVLN